MHRSWFIVQVTLYNLVHGVFNFKIKIGTRVLGDKKGVKESSMDLGRSVF